MAAIPFMPFYISDYLADTAHLETLDHGVYLLFIMNYWQTQKPLPNDDKKLAKIARLSLKKFQNLKPNVIEFFSVTSEEWRHSRIDKELVKYREKVEIARLAGKKSAEKRQKNNPTDVQPTLNESSTSVQPTFNHTESESYTDKDINQTHCPVVQKTDNADDVGNVSPSDEKAVKKKTKEEKEISCRTEAKEIIDFLNQMANKHFRHSDSHLKLIMARLKSGVEAIDCRRVIITMVETWKKNPNPKFANLDYATPDTLFNATKFEKYFSETKKQFREFYHEE